MRAEMPPPLFDAVLPEIVELTTPTTGGWSLGWVLWPSSEMPPPTPARLS